MMDPAYIQEKKENEKLLDNSYQYQSFLYIAVNTRPHLDVSVSILGRQVKQMGLQQREFWSTWKLRNS